jgi:tetratricopeptide (TPR) repeat protein
MGLVHHYCDWDFTAAERAYRRAIALNPNSGLSRAYFGIVLEYSGRFDEAIIEATQGRMLEPVSGLVGFYLARILCLAGRHDEALDECRRVLELDPNLPLALWIEALALSLLGRHDQAVEAAERAVSQTRRQSFYLGLAASTLAAAGRRQEAQTMVNELRERSRQEYVSPLYFAEVAIALGDLDQAFEWLERAYEDRSPFLRGAGVFPHYDRLRRDARFETLLKKLGLAGVSPAVR